MNDTALTAVDTSMIPGWGVDADPKNDPTYPYRDRSQDPGLKADWERPPQQQPEVEILQSIEHNSLPAVFGTSTPPRWVSGMIRRAAFRWSESNWLHWLLLMGADRVNVVEGVVQDLGRARIPNIPAEMGIRSELRHNKAGFGKKIAATVAVSAAIYGLMQLRGRSRRNENEGTGTT
ncbi:MAG TPA: hypothetical protein VNT77_05125 [Allosphingosinicella sp.]|nr:hypothetical protein [Allosphingosinicella sp.]